MTDALTKRYELYISLESSNRERMSSITTPVSLVKPAELVKSSLLNQIHIQF